MLIKEVSKGLFDVFVGVGWDHWSRFQYQKKSLLLVKGRPLNRKDYELAKSSIEAM